MENNKLIQAKKEVLSNTIKYDNTQNSVLKRVEKNDNVKLI